MRLVDLEVEEEIAVRGTQLQARAVAVRGRQVLRIRRDAPVLAISIEQRRAAQCEHVQIALLLGVGP